LEIGDAAVERFETDVVLKDGSLLMCGQCSDDRTPLVSLIKSLSAETFYLRFLHAVDPEEAVKWLMSGAGRFALLATREGKVIGHAVCAVTSPGKADAAVVVADAYQGKGLGTILLGQLAEVAVTAGISVLEAQVAPENVRMIGVLRHLGFPTILKSEPGFVRVTFPASLLPKALVRFEQREAVAAVAAMEKFFCPRGVAVIGASRERGTIGGELFRNLVESGFQGPVYPVNAKAEVVQSVVAYRSVLDCPGPVDLAFIVVPAPAVVPVARECAGKEVRALVVISAGFAESGEAGAASAGNW
jgi:GNAT superfamily N-acetyltransferase/predicted CoA-binding protein